jgi:hypothetical protein
MTEFNITVKFRVNLDRRPTAEQIENELYGALGHHSEIDVVSILHTDEEFLKALENDVEL